MFAVTESILARAQANYTTTDQLAADVKAKLGGETVGVVFPILSRNRFCHLPQRHGQRRQEDRPHAQLSQRRSGQPPAGH